MSVTVRRKARKPHRCDGCASPNIKPGDVYLTHTALSGDEFGYHEYVNEPKRPQRFAECSGCATRYGRGPLLDPSWGQAK